MTLAVIPIRITKIQQKLLQYKHIDLLNKLAYSNTKISSGTVQFSVRNGPEM